MKKLEEEKIIKETSMKQLKFLQASKLIKGHLMDYSPKYFYEKNGLIFKKAGWFIVPVDIARRS